MVQLDKYPFLLILIACIGGILAYQYIPNAYTWVLLGTVLLLIFTVIVTLLHQYKHYILYSSLFCFSGLCYIVSYFQDSTSNHNWYGTEMDHSALLFGTINSAAKETEKTFQYEVAIDSLLVGDSIKTKTGKILLYIYKDENLKNLEIGNSIAIPNKLIIINNSGNPHSFDYKKFLARSNIYHQCFLPNDEIILLKDTKQSKNFVQNLKKFLSNSLDKNVADNDTKQLLKASLLNERIHLSDELWESYSKTGIVHIIAISGMHISLLFGIIIFIFRLIRHKKYIWITYAIAIPIVWLYIIITDLPASAVRAGLMFSITALSIFIQKPQQSLNTLFATATIMLLVHPTWLYDIGMQLSFLCMLSIILFYQPIFQLLSSPSVVLNLIAKSFAMSVAVQVLTAPIAMYYFNQFPIFTFIANIPAAVYSTFLLLCGLAIFVLEGVGLPASFIGIIASSITKYFNLFIDFLAVLTPKNFQTISIDGLDMILIIIISISIVNLFIKKSIVHFQAALVGILLFTISNIITLYFNSNYSNFIVYNITQKSYQLHIAAAHYNLIQCDSLSPKQFKWNVLPSLMRANANKPQTSKETFIRINNTNIMVLGKNTYAFTSTIPFPLDVVVLNDDNFNQIAAIINYLPAKLYVLDSSFKRWQFKKVEHILSNQNLAFHNVQTMGAWQMINYLEQ